MGLKLNFKPFNRGNAPFSGFFADTLLAGKTVFGVFIALSLLFVGFGIKNGLESVEDASRLIEFESTLQGDTADLQASENSLFKQVPARPILNKVTDRIKLGETLSAALARYNIAPKEQHALAEALRKHLNLRLIRAGDVFVLEHTSKMLESNSNGQGIAVAASFDAFELVRTERDGVPVRYRATRDPKDLSFVVTKLETPVDVRVAGISGSLRSSLYDAIIQAGGDAGLVNRFATVFGSQIDFSADLQEGDTFRLIVEQRSAAGRPIGYGRILAAEYNNAGKRYRGFHYKSKDGKTDGLFTEKGESLIKSFLKNPMDFFRISSGFNPNRRHPVLGYHRKHNGTDFAAPTGTPYWAVADGTVVATGYDGGRGRYIQVKHRNGYMTEYFHSSRIAKGIRPGVSVKMGQVIGYVGSTGLASGPHLHLGIKVNGRYVDFTKQKFPGGPSIPPTQMAMFRKQLSPLVASLDVLSGDGTVRLSLNP